MTSGNPDAPRLRARLQRWATVARC